MNSDLRVLTMWLHGKLVRLWKAKIERKGGFARKNKAGTFINLKGVNARFLVSTEFLLSFGMSNALFGKCYLQWNNDQPLNGWNNHQLLKYFQDSNQKICNMAFK